MSKHIYKFGDRVTVDGKHRAIVIGPSSSWQYFVLIHGSDTGEDWPDDDLTPGWPVPEGCVRVRAAVGIDPDGSYFVCGGSGWADHESQGEVMPATSSQGAFHFIEADIPLPTPKTYRAEVVS